MDPLVYGLWCAVVIIAIVALEPLFPQAVDLVVQWFLKEVERRYLLLSFRIRLHYDRLTLNSRHPLAGLLRAVELWRIRHNPAYREFFDNDHPKH